MPFCYSPWTNIDIDPTGKITPCCKFQVKYYPRVFNLQTDSVDDYVNSDFLQSIKDEFNKDQWPAGCERCRIEEENGVDSKRILDYQRWEEHYARYRPEQPKFITASIAFGNTCNLKCITCTSYASSRWQQEYKDVYNIDFPHFKFYRKNFVRDFIAQAPGLVHIDIPGGEPFLSGIDEQRDLLKHYISTGQSANITLHYTTNGTIFPEQEWWDLWQHFKEIDLQLSIDGVDNRYEYIRFPAEWTVLELNVQQYIEQETKLSNFRLSVSHTVSAYNIYYLDEFVSWCYNIGLPEPWMGRVHTPQHMRPSIWSGPAKDIIIQKLECSRYEIVRKWATVIRNTDDKAFFEEFQQRTEEHDLYRRLNFRNTFPELAPYL